MATSATGSRPEFVADAEGPKQTEEDGIAVRDEARAVLWHQRVAHLSYSGLAKTADLKMVQGLPMSEADFSAAASIHAMCVRGRGSCGGRTYSVCCR